MVELATSGQHRIPIRNIWLLLLYSSELFRQLDGERRNAVEENPDDIPDLVAEILAYAVERRLHRNLSLGWRRREAELTRVRGRIDLLRTEARQLLERGKVACRFEELTIDTPRNRLVRAALAKLAGVIIRQDLSRRCRTLAARLEHLGVSGERPPRSQVSLDTFGHSDATDRLMVAAAHLAFDLDLPTEDPDRTVLPIPSRDLKLWELFEKAVAGFYSVVLSPHGWHVAHGSTMPWHQERPTSGIAAILPLMRTDIVLEHPGMGHRVVIDTKFNDILTQGQYGKDSLRSANIYQIYAYLRSQENSGNPLAANAAGLLLHPAIGEMVDEAAVIQGHPIRFATVDLAGPAREIRQRLLAVKDKHPANAG